MAKEEKKKRNVWKIAFWVLLILVVFGLGADSNDSEEKLRMCEDESRELRIQASDYRIRIFDLETEVNSLKEK